MPHRQTILWVSNRLSLVPVSYYSRRGQAAQGMLFLLWRLRQVLDGTGAGRHGSNAWLRLYDASLSCLFKLASKGRISQGPVSLVLVCLVLFWSGQLLVDRAELHQCFSMGFGWKFLTWWMVSDRHWSVSGVFDVSSALRGLVSWHWSSSFGCLVLFSGFYWHWRYQRRWLDAWDP